MVFQELWSTGRAKKDFVLRWTGNSAETQKLHSGSDSQWRSANKWGKKGLCSRSWPLRDCAIVTRYACSLNAWKTLRRTRIFIWVGNMSTTSRTDNFVPFVFAGVSENSGIASTSSSPIQDLPSSNSIKERSNESTPNNRCETHQTTKKQNKKKNDNRSWDESLRDLHRDACAGTHFSGFGFGTPNKNGFKFKEAQYLCSHPKRSKLGKYACGQRWQGFFVDDVTEKRHLVAEEVGDLITADHTVLNEEGEARNNHRYAVVVQNFDTQLTQSHLCKTQTSQEKEKSSRRVFEPSQKPKVKFALCLWQFAWAKRKQMMSVWTHTLYMQKAGRGGVNDVLPRKSHLHWHFIKIWKILSWNHRTSTLHRSVIHGIAERAKRRSKECSSILLQQSRDWMKSGLLILRNAIAVFELSKTFWQMGKLPLKDDSENHFQDP